MCSWVPLKIDQKDWRSGKRNEMKSISLHLSRSSRAVMSRKLNCLCPSLPLQEYFSRRLQPPISVCCLFSYLSSSSPHLSPLTSTFDAARPLICMLRARFVCIRRPPPKPQTASKLMPLWHRNIYCVLALDWCRCIMPHKALRHSHDARHGHCSVIVQTPFGGYLVCCRLK